MFCDCGRKLYWIDCSFCGEGDYVCECGQWPTDIVQGKVDHTQMDLDFCETCSALEG